MAMKDINKTTEHLVHIMYSLDEDDREGIIKEQEDLGLVYFGEANIIEGDFLQFITKEDWLTRVIRPERDALLKQSDMLMLADIAERLKANGTYNAVIKYRQKLRDVPAKVKDGKVEWPIPPNLEENNDSQV